MNIVKNKKVIKNIFIILLSIEYISFGIMIFIGSIFKVYENETIPENYIFFLKIYKKYSFDIVVIFVVTLLCLFVISSYGLRYIKEWKNLYAFCLLLLLIIFTVKFIFGF